MVRELLWVVLGAAGALAGGIVLLFSVTFGAVFLPREQGTWAVVATALWALLTVAALGAGGLALLDRVFGRVLARRHAPAPAPTTRVDVVVGAAVWRRSGRCPVCRTQEVRRSIVWCARCLTPHHEDCWRYTGKCAVFACGGTAPRTPSPP